MRRTIPHRALCVREQYTFAAGLFNGVCEPMRRGLCDEGQSQSQASTHPCPTCAGACGVDRALALHVGLGRRASVGEAQHKIAIPHHGGCVGCAAGTCGRRACQVRLGGKCLCLLTCLCQPVGQCWGWDCFELYGDPFALYVELNVLTRRKTLQMTQRFVA